MDKENVVYTMEYYPPTTKNKSPIICKDMGGTVVHYPKLNRKGTDKQGLHYVTYKRTLASLQSTMKLKIEWWLPVEEKSWLT